MITFLNILLVTVMAVENSNGRISKLKFGNRVSLRSWETRLPHNNWKLEVRDIFLYLYKKYPGKGQ